MKKILLTLTMIIFLIINQLQAQLNGTYTIGPSGNYTSFTAAVSALTTSGVNGPVVFNIAPGTYTEQITIDSIPGTSPVNTITFQSLSNDSTSVILQFTPTVSLNNFTVNFSSAKNIIFKKLTIKSNAIGNYSRVINLSGNISNIKFQNCVLLGHLNTNTTSSLEKEIVYGIFNSGYLSGFECSNSNVFYGKDCIYLTSNVYNSIRNINLFNNYFNTNHRGCIRIQNGDTINILNNLISNHNVYNSSHYGIILTNCQNSNVIKNRLDFMVSTGSSTLTGISIGKTNSLNYINSRIYNNFISLYNTLTDNNRGISVNTSNIECFFNSVNLISQQSANNYSIMIYESIYSPNTNIKVINNYFVNQSNGVCLRSGVNRFSNKFDFNNYYSTGTYICQSDSFGSFSSINAWSSIMLGDSNSTSINPNFLSNTDLHVTNALLNNLGTPVQGIIEDIDGDIRSLTSPDIGADEFNISATDLGAVSLIRNSLSECYDTNETFSVKVKNYGTATCNFALTPASIIVSVSGTNSMNFPTYTLSSGILLKDSILTVPIPTNFNMSQQGNYLFNVSAFISTNDGNTGNNYMAPVQYKNGLISLFPSIENLESFTNGSISTNTGWSSVSTSSFEWFINSGTTITNNTGPSADHSIGSNFGKYVYAEASNSTTGSIAYLYSPCINLGTLSNPKLSFWYHAYGSGIGSLFVDVYNGSSWVNGVYSFSGQQQTSSSANWQQAIVSLSAFSGTIKIRFRAIRGATEFGDIALDDIGIGSAPVVNLGPNINICVGGNTILNAGAGNGYTYSWTKSPSSVVIGTNQTLTVSTAGIYIVAVTNSMGLTGIDTIAVTVSSPPVANAGGSQSVCAGSSKTISGASAQNFSSLLWTTSGTGTYANPALLNAVYSPSSADISAVSVYLKLNVIGISPCSNAADSILLTINPLPVVSFTGLDTSYCLNTSPVVLNGYPSGGTFSGTGVSGSVFNPAIAGVGTYSITYSYQQGSTGCIGIQQKTVKVKALPAVSFIGLPSSVCFGFQTYALFGSPSGGTFSGTGISGNIFSPVTAGVGTHTISYQSPADASGCSNIQTQTVVVNPQPSVTFSGLSLQYCANSAPVNLTATPAGGIFSGSGVSGNIFNPTVAGVGNHIISYSYTGANGCSSTASLSTTVQAVPVANAGTDATVIYGSTANLSGSATGSGSFSYSWSPSNLLVNPSIQNPTTVTMTATAIFTLQVSNTTTGCQSSDQMQLTVTGTALSANCSANPSTLCAGDSTHLLALGTGGTGNFTYLWSSAPAGLSSNLQNPTVTPTITTTYTVQIGDGITTSTATKTVTVNPKPVVSISGLNSIYCSTDAGSAISVTPTGGTLTGPGVVGSFFDPSIISSGNIQVTYSYTNTYGCKNTATANVQVNQTPVSNAGQDNTLPCGYPGVQIGTTSQSGLAYLWSPTTGLSNPAIANPVAQPGISTVYTVTTTNTSSGCSSKDSVKITVLYGPTAYAGHDTTICKGSSITLSATGGSYYQWNSGANAQSITVTPVATSTFIVTVTQGICSAMDTVMVTVSNPQVLLIAPDSLYGTFCILDAGLGFISYLWQDSSTNQTFNTGGVIPVYGYNTFYVTVIDSFGCIASDTVIIYIWWEGIEENLSFSFIKIFPNPSAGIFNLEIENNRTEEIEICLYSLQGKLVRCEKTTISASKNLITLNYQGVAKGVYYLRVASEGKLEVRKVVVR